MPRRDTAPPTSQPSEQFVVFSVGSEEYAAPVLQVAEIVPMLEITPFPDAPVYILGLVNLRGSILPVLDLAKRLQLETRSAYSQEHIMVVEDEQKARYGIVVSRVKEVLRIAVDSIKTAPHIIDTAVKPGDLDGIIVLSDESGVSGDARVVPVLDIQAIVAAIPIDKRQGLADAADPAAIKDSSKEIL